MRSVLPSVVFSTMIVSDFVLVPVYIPTLSIAADKAEVLSSHLFLWLINELLTD